MAEEILQTFRGDGMKIAVIGANGRVGQAIMKKALSDGHDVRGLVRRHPTDDTLMKTVLVYGNAKNAHDIYETIKGCDLVFSALGTDKTDTLSTSIPYTLQAMERENISRIVTIGTAGILDSRYEPGKFRFQTNESKRRSTFAAREHAKVYQFLEQSNLEWTIICPTYLPDGEEQGDIRFEKNRLPKGGNKITVSDTARFAYEELFAKRHLQCRVGICY